MESLPQFNPGHGFLPQEHGVIISKWENGFQPMFLCIQHQGRPVYIERGHLGNTSVLCVTDLQPYFTIMDIYPHQ